MKRKIISILIVLAVLASGVIACTPKGGYLVQVMKIAPQDTIMISCMDIEAMAENPDFGFMYDSFMVGMSQMVGVDVSAISATTTMTTDGDDFATVLIGALNLEDARDALIEEDWVEGEYEGVEIWTDDYGLATTFIDNMLVTGDIDSVEACIRIHKNEEPSMYDNEDTRAVADKLPVVPYRMVVGSNYYMIVIGSDYYMSEFKFLSYSFGLSNEHRDDETLDISGWFKFDSETSAEVAMEDIEDIMETEFGATSIDTRLSGQFIEITAKTEIPEY